MDLVNYVVFPACRHVFPFRSKYSLQPPVLKNLSNSRVVEMQSRKKGTASGALAPHAVYLKPQN
jgi:hypothetical protein